MKLKLAIAGFKHGHVGAYANAINTEMNDAQVVWGWDRDTEFGKQQCKDFGCEFCSDLDELLAQKDLSGVIIGSETSTHADVAVAAAKAGKDMLLQKPMALTLEDCDRIVNAVKSAGVKFSMAWQMRCDPQNIWMREAVQSGRFGKIVMLRRRHGLGTHLWAGFADTWHVKPELNRGMWMDDASHPTDLLLWMLGKPTSVIAEIDTLINPKVPDDNGVAIYRFPGGAIGIVECSFTCVAAEETTLIVGEKGSIVQDFGDGVSCGVTPIPEGTLGLKYLMAGDKEWTPVNIPTPSSHGYRIYGVARPAVEFFLGKRDPIASVEEGRTNIQMMLASYQSAIEGKRIKIV